MPTPAPTLAAALLALHLQAAPVLSANDPATLTLTGVVTFQGHRIAYITRAAPGQAPRPFQLREGEEVDGLKVLSLDARAGRVRVTDHGLERMLTFVTPAGPGSDPAQAEKQFVEEHRRAHALREAREKLRPPAGSSTDPGPPASTPPNRP